ncbi:hypothetical protein LSTR_LSTR016918 [Laodelphax striatellus]|uniref:Uncharacterized protein n=1 Tax=Laodelphax striatellus TaxID=195883 RepID=A0A482WX19_LAOST|nr:hypothetical protein LSTR_LSTR016918 [Laodelphax striatellus]
MRSGGLETHCVRTLWDSLCQPVLELIKRTIRQQSLFVFHASLYDSSLSIRWSCCYVLAEKRSSLAPASENKDHALLFDRYAPHRTAQLTGVSKQSPA